MDRRAWRSARSVFAVALLARIAFVVTRGVGRIGDSQLYLDLAANLRLHGCFSSEAAWPFTSSVRVPPVYPLLLAALNGNAVAVVAVQLLLDSSVAAAVLFLARGRAGARWAIVAALGWALHPGAIAAAGTLQTESVFTALVVAAVVALVAAVARDRLPLTAPAGALFGLASLCRSIGLLMPAALLLALVATGGVRRLRRHGALLLLTAALVVAPWTVRSSLAAGRLVLVQVGGSSNIYIPSRWDWNQQDPGDVWGRFRRDPDTQAFIYARTPLELVEADHALSQRAFDNIRSQPVRYLRSRLRNYPRLVLTSFASFTRISAAPAALVAARDMPRVLLKVGPLLPFALLPLVLALFGLASALQSPEEAACACVWLTFLVIHLPLWIEYRFWLPAVPFLHVTAAMGGSRLGGRLRRG